MKDPNSYGLLIVDIQGRLAKLVDGSDELIANTAKLIKGCQLLSIPVVVLEQNPAGLGATDPAIQASLADYQPLEKYSFNGLAEPHIQQQIQAHNKANWLVAGIEAHICVYQSVQGLLAQGIQVEVVSDCIASRRQSNKDLAIANMRQLGAGITSVEMILYELMGNSKVTQFRDMLTILK